MVVILEEISKNKLTNTDIFRVFWPKIILLIMHTQSLHTSMPVDRMIMIRG